MLTKRSFRVLIVAEMILAAVGAVVGVVGRPWLPEPLRAFEQARAEADLTASDWVLFGVGVPLAIATLVAAIGLLVFWRPARPLYLAAVIVAMLLTPFGGPYISSGWDELLSGTSLMTTGIVLAVIYFSPIRELFEKPRQAA